MFDSINRLWHEICGKLHHCDETKHRSHKDHIKKFGYHKAIGVKVASPSFSMKCGGNDVFGSQATLNSYLLYLAEPHRK